ncbi:MAG: presqualene diphosphate synthase HpnD [Betaproteobacteria bacterium]|nr:MAG: presqualene diphosphate synthase HpnD [Betaproteobacteria bacterium]
MNPDKYCRDRVAKSGSSFYYSFLFLPPERRSAITALYAFCREVDDVVDDMTDPDIARAKLAWWRQEIGLAYAGTAQHPVARALQPVITRYALPEAQFQTVIDGMTMDLEQNRYLDFSSLEQYCHRVAGVVGLMSAEIFGYDHPDTRVYARDLGIAFQLTNILRDVGEDARRGRIYLPQDDLARFEVAPSSLLGGKGSDAFRRLMAFEAVRTRAWYARALAKLDPRDRRSQRAGLIMAAIYRTLLDEIAHDGFNVLDRRTSLTPLRKLWIAWKTARKSA